jgi:CPA1 family monovalent cation:H+ antiporter
VVVIMSGLLGTARDVLSRIVGAGSVCSHLEQARNVEPRTEGCEECLASGLRWVHLRLCLSCGHVGCCDQSEGRHARSHFESSGHPIARSHEPGEVWSWCWVDQVEV